MTRPLPMEARDPWDKAGKAEAPAPPEKIEVPSPWMQHTAWIADPSAAPVEYLEPLKQLGFTQLCVRATHGENALPISPNKYHDAGWNVVYWGRVDQKLGEDVRADPVGAAAAAAEACDNEPFAANVEIRWSETDSAQFTHWAMTSHDALCTYPGGIPDGAHRYYQQAGVRVILVQTFGEAEPYGISMFDASRWGLSLGYEIVLPMVGTFRGPNGYADAMLQADALGSLPRHCYLVEQSGWRHISGSGYEWEKLMAGVR